MHPSKQKGHFWVDGSVKPKHAPGGVMNQQPSRFIALRGCAALIIAMGIGRFAFTPLLPPMQAEVQFSDASAGLLASFNLFGYLAGALLGARIPHGRREATYRAALAVAVLADLLMAAPLGVPGWSLIRAAAGISSGIIFVLSAAFVIEHRGALALHFTGVGIGIALSGLIAALVPAWQTAWLVLAVLSFVLAMFAGRLTGVALPAGQPHVRRPLAWDAAFFWLITAYGLNGVGYIVSGTFLVAILHSLPQTAKLGPLAWIIVGISAIPSTLAWSRLAGRLGSWHALAAAYAAQAIAIVLPFAGVVATLVAAVLFGGTFVAITSLSLPLAARLRPAQAGQAVALLTIIYGLGQAIGPPLAGFAADATKSFTLPLLCAAAIVALGGLLSLAGERSARRGLSSGHGKDANPRH
jgi:predicted MFS family arabinose efflux permease